MFKSGLFFVLLVCGMSSSFAATFPPLPLVDFPPLPLVTTLPL